MRRSAIPRRQPTCWQLIPNGSPRERSSSPLSIPEPPPGRPRTDKAHRRKEWPDDLREIVYIDHYGNAMSGLRAVMLPRDARLVVAGRLLERAGTFSDRPPGTAFWYENSNGLAEIAVNQGRADRELNLAIGSPVEIVE